MNNEEDNVGTAQAYYDESRKRSFFYSRVFVFVSMFVLFVALTINLTVLSSSQKTNTQSNASYDDPSKLPALPAGCKYIQNGTKTLVICPTQAPVVTPTPVTNPAFPISVNLPSLPPQCSYAASGTGSAVTCSSQVVIPPATVTLPAACKPGVLGEAAVVCVDAANQPVTVTLPALPTGCAYEKTATTLSVVCKGSTVQ